MLIGYARVSTPDQDLALHERALADIDTPDEVARHIAPLGWEHIALTSDYSWEPGDQPGPDQLRPPRISPSLLAA
jgi:microsomal dipeptidase-like Zn-dependent dipeptidase